MRTSRWTAVKYEKRHARGLPRLAHKMVKGKCCRVWQGHYTSHVKQPLSGSWMRIDDENVSEVRGQGSSWLRRQRRAATVAGLRRVEQLR